MLWYKNSSISSFKKKLLLYEVFPYYAFISIVIILQTVKSVQNKSSSDLKIQNNILSVCLCFATARVQFILSGLPIAVKMDARKIVSAKVQLKYAFCHIHTSL